MDPPPNLRPPAVATGGTLRRARSPVPTSKGNGTFSASSTPPLSPFASFATHNLSPLSSSSGDPSPMISKTPQHSLSRRSVSGYSYNHASLNGSEGEASVNEPRHADPDHDHFFPSSPAPLHLQNPAGSLFEDPEEGQNTIEARMAEISNRNKDGAGMVSAASISPIPGSRKGRATILNSASASHVTTSSTSSPSSSSSSTSTTATSTSSPRQYSSSISPLPARPSSTTSSSTFTSSSSQPTATTADIGGDSLTPPRQGTVARVSPPNSNKSSPFPPRTLLTHYTSPTPASPLLNPSTSSSNSPTHSGSMRRMMSPPAIPSHLGKTREAGWSSAVLNNDGGGSSRAVVWRDGGMEREEREKRGERVRERAKGDEGTRFNLETSLMLMEDDRMGPFEMGRMVEMESVNQEDANMCKVAAEEGGVMGSPHPGIKKAVMWGGSEGSGGMEGEEDDVDSDVGGRSSSMGMIDNSMFSDDENDNVGEVTGEENDRGVVGIGGVGGGRRGGHAQGIGNKSLASSFGVRVGVNLRGGNILPPPISHRGSSSRVGRERVGARPPRRMSMVQGQIKRKKVKSHKSLTSPSFSPPPTMHPIYVESILCTSQEHALNLVRTLREGEDTWCKCRKSRCLKLYCDCFQAGSVCSSTCGCVDCLNTELHSGNDGIRTNAVINALIRRPDAFKRRVREPGNGCGCKNSGCLKKYCECFREGNSCSIGVCKCQGCKNYDGFKGVGKGRKGGGIVTSVNKRVVVSEGLVSDVGGRGEVVGFEGVGDEGGGGKVVMGGEEVIEGFAKKRKVEGEEMEDGGCINKPGIIDAARVSITPPGRGRKA